jgi:hypothetical protein
MFRRIALSAGLSFLAVTTIVAVFDYFRLLYRPDIPSEWQLHYSLLVATPIEATMLAYTQAFLDCFLSPIPAFATGLATVLLVIVQVLAAERRDNRLGGFLERLRAGNGNRFSTQGSRTA